MTDDWKSKYDDVDSFYEGLAYVKLNGQWGFVDRQGNVVVPLMYDDTEFFSEGLAQVRLGDGETGKYGFVDKTGKEVIPLMYDWVAWFFSGGLAEVKLNGKIGYVDKTGHEYWDMTEDEARQKIQNR